MTDTPITPVFFTVAEAKSVLRIGRSKLYELMAAGEIRPSKLHGKTLIAVLHDMHQVSRHFPQAMLLAREVIAWGATETVVTEANLNRARGLPTAPNPDARECHRRTPEHAE